jgi:hypothetical protein
MEKNSKIERSLQSIANHGFDEAYNQPTVLPVVEKDGVLVRQQAIATEAKQDDIIEAIENITVTAESIAGLNIPQHDEIQATYPTSSSEVYTYLMDSVQVGQVTVVYSDSSKNTLTSVSYV